VDRVAEAIDDSAVAIVAPHFLGIPQPLSDLLDICKRNDVTLVEDSAQLGPTSPAFAPKADLVILSFGRGKPIPVGGGVLISRSNMREALAAETLGIFASRVSSWGWQVRRMLQNAAMSPLGYRMVRSLPFLGVGETRFRPLIRVRLLEGEGVALAEGIIALWKQDVTPAQRYLCELSDSAELLNLPSKMQLDGRAPLLRYPLLLDCQSTRDRLLEMLGRHGIGATNLYGQSLPAILRARSEVSFVKASWPHADDFARRLITIPVHSGVHEADLEIIRGCIATCLRARMVKDSRT
jgi:dTDP-4-amino-4,6-dideoxygalactose transaminase